MPDFQKMPSMATRDITVDVLLERIQNNFRILRTGPIDEAELKQDLEDLVEGVKEIGQELMNEYGWLKELLEAIRSEERKAQYIARLETDREQLVETRTRIQAIKGLVAGTENVVEVVYKITAARSLLGRLQNPSAQRSMSQSLSKISVAQEKVFDGRRGLVELTGELERRGLEARLLEGETETRERLKAAQLAARSAAERLNAEGATGNGARGDRTPQAGRSAIVDKTPRSGVHPVGKGSSPGPSAGGARQTSPRGESERVVPKSRIRPVRGTRADDTRTMRPVTVDTADLSRADAERAKRALNDWSRWKPLAPVNLGDTVRIVGASTEEATLIRIQSLVGERKWRGEVSRARTSSHLEQRQSLWDLPASPPSQSTSATEESDYCETSYRPRHLEHLLYAGDVPPDLLREVTGKVLLQEDLSACRNGVVEANLEERCLKALSKWSSSTEVSEHFKIGQGQSGDVSGGTPAARLVRSSLAVESIPVLRLECELGLRRGRHYLVEAWLCGDERKLHLGDVPRTWTWKTTAWLAVITTLGIPLGFLLARLVQA